MEVRFGEKNFEEFETLVLRSLDVSVVADLNSGDAGLWEVVVGLLKKYLQPGEYPHCIHATYCSVADNRPTSAC